MEIANEEKRYSTYLVRLNFSNCPTTSTYFQLQLYFSISVWESITLMHNPTKYCVSNMLIRLNTQIIKIVKIKKKNKKNITYFNEEARAVCWLYLERKWQYCYSNK